MVHGYDYLQNCRLQ